MLHKFVQQPVVSSQKVPSQNLNEGEQLKTVKESHSFNLLKELEKLKVPIPLTKLVKTPMYKKQVCDFINLSQDNHSTNEINFQEERLVVMFGPHVEEQDTSTSPFYIYLLMHTFILQIVCYTWEHLII